MYLPNRFKNSDLSAALQIMKSYPLATVISQTDKGPFVSHLPLVVEQVGNDLRLVGHLARGNPHWRMMDGQPVLVIFNGPNAYVTPKWYAENDVPTWNYAVVHISGTSSLIEDVTGIQRCLEKLTNAVETGSDPWKFWIPDDLVGDGVLEKVIVGFTIKAESVQAKFKLSQNRSAEDRAGVIRGLETRSDQMSREICKLMKSSNIGGSQ